MSKSEHLDGERSPCFDVQSDEKNTPYRRREEMPNLRPEKFCCRNSVELQSLFFLRKRRL